MKQIICPLSYIPVRKEPSHQSEQVNQLLFGEAAIVEEEIAEWYYIKCEFDNYTGWIEKKVVKILENGRTSTPNIINAFARLISINGTSQWLSTGCEISADLIDSSSSTVVTINPELNHESVIEIAMQFLGTPYLWGGKSFMGIDCSGLIQVIFKAVNIHLPRDASQQVELGDVVQFPSEALPGDLAFFDNDEGAITHIGMIIDTGKIIHASGHVRIDTIDHQGIFNAETKNYSHKLRVIKRIIK